MTDTQNTLGKALWKVADTLRGNMDATHFQEYMLSILFVYYISDNYEKIVKQELGDEYPKNVDDSITPLMQWAKDNPQDIAEMESHIQSLIHYTIPPEYLWSNLARLAKNDNERLLEKTKDAFEHIETNSFDDAFEGLFSDINLNSEKLGKTHENRNEQICKIIKNIDSGIKENATENDNLGDAYEYLIAQFASASGKKSGEFYTPQCVSNILSQIVSLDCQDPKQGVSNKIGNILDFACGSGALLLNLKKQVTQNDTNIGTIYGQEKNITTYNLARMNMILHKVKSTDFNIYHGDTLKNDWDIMNPNIPNKITFDAIIANPPYSLKWEPKEETAQDPRFKKYGVSPKSAADFAFLLHGFYYLAKSGTMAIVLPHGVLFRGNKEFNIRKKLLTDNNIDAVIGLPQNLFYSTGIPVCIIVLKKCKKNDDVLFIDASKEYTKNKKQNELEQKHITDIVQAYRNRGENEKKNFARAVSIQEIKENDYNLNIPRYISNIPEEEPIDLQQVGKEMQEIEESLQKNKKELQKYIDELNQYIETSSEKIPNIP